MEDVVGERVHDTMQMLKAVRADCSRRGQVLVSMSQTKPDRQDRHRRRRRMDRCCRRHCEPAGDLGAETLCLIKLRRPLAGASRNRHAHLQRSRNRPSPACRCWPRGTVCCAASPVTAAMFVPVSSSWRSIRAAGWRNGLASTAAARRHRLRIDHRASTSKEMWLLRAVQRRNAVQAGASQRLFAPHQAARFEAIYDNAKCRSARI